VKICVKGSKGGLWKDFATGEWGNNLLDLLHQDRRNLDCRTTCGEAAAWLGDAESETHGENVKGGCERAKANDFGDLCDGEDSDLCELAKLLLLNGDALPLAAKDGVLKFFDHRANGRCWSIVDKQHFVRQDRRLDGRPFILSDGGEAKSRTIGSPKIPIGLPTERQIIALVEGSSDFLAAYSLIYAEELDGEIAPVAMLGAMNTINDASLEHFRKKHVIGFPDYDSAGFGGMSRWERQLKGIAATFHVFDYGGLSRDDGERIKDLRDFVRIDVDQWESDWEARCPFSNFISKILSERTYVTH
jgi:hypothetical protein